MQARLDDEAGELKLLNELLEKKFREGAGTEAKDATLQ
jgi:hypothetical protein